MENTNMNANVNALGRPVMLKDIAGKLGISKWTVINCLRKNYEFPNSKTCRLVRETAKEMGYDAAAAIKYGRKTTGAANFLNASRNVSRITQEDIAVAVGASRTTVALALNGRVSTELGRKIRDYANSVGYKTPRKKDIENREDYWYGTSFKSRKELVAYCEYLRKEGYGNTEIAKKAGVTIVTVRRNIGAEPIALAKHNRVVGQKLRAQKNAARRSYLHNQPIAEYNAKVDEHNALKAKVAAMEAELAAQTPAIEQAAAKKVYVPNLNLAQLSPTALQ